MNVCQESDSDISSMMPWSVSFLFVAISLNALQQSSTTNPKPSESLNVIQVSALPNQLHVFALTRNGLKC